MRAKIIQYPLIMSFLLSLLILEIGKQSQLYFEFDKYNKGMIRGALAIIVLMFVHKYFSSKELFLQIKSRKNNKIGLIILLFVVGIFILVLAQSHGLSWINITVIIKNLAIGIFEEGIFRSLCFGLLLIKLAYKSNFILKAAIYSSLLFSSLHLINLLDKEITESLILSTAFQLLYSFLLGFGFAGITLAFGSIWVCIGLHAIINMYSDIDIFFPNDIRYCDNMLNNLFIPALCLVIIISGSFVLFKNNNLKKSEQR